MSDGGWHLHNLLGDDQSRRLATASPQLDFSLTEGFRTARATIIEDLLAREDKQ
jgi:hypothetical protein